MSRKDYIAIAKMLKEQGSHTLEDGSDFNAFRVYNDICRGMCEVLASDNANFNRDRFLTACGYTN